MLAWYDVNKRDLPWRDCGDPYKVWVSEVMSQQTRIEAMKPYYDNWMTAALLKGKDVAVFGLGDKENYEDYFCWSADLLSKKVKECGANLVCEPLKVDGEPDDNEDAVVAWAKGL